MASISPSPNSPPASVSPNTTAPTTTPTTTTTTTTTTTPSPTSSPTSSPPPPLVQPNATSDPPPPTSPTNTSSPPPDQSPPPPPPIVSSAAPTPVSLSPPPPTPVVPPPVPTTSPPPAVSPPPPTTTTPVADPPSSPPPAPPTPVVSPPPPNRPPPPVSPSPPVDTSPPPTEASPPPPSPVVSPPPSNSTTPLPSSSPPPPPSPVVSSPPPPSNSTTPLPSSSPPPPSANPPRTSPSPPPPPPTPSVSQPASPPLSNSPPTTPSPPVNQTQPTPSSPSPPSSPSAIPPTVPQNNTPSGVSPTIPTQPLPTQPTGDPTNNSTNSTNPSPGAPENVNSNSSGGISAGGAAAIGIIAGIFVLSLIGLGVWFWRKEKKKVAGYHAGHVMPSPLGSSPVSETSFIKAYSSASLIGNGSGNGFIYSPPESGGLGNSRSWFTYQELVEVTNGFSTQNLLGEGGFGCVYKGILADGREVAVKQLKVGGSQGEREFSAEVETISRVHHRHLVSLVGYCISEHQRLLVYDYVPNNTLYYHLHGEGSPVLDWATRVKVATGAARGISYLHEDCHPRIIHRDIKSSNILLDNNFEAQVSDFGLAKLDLDANTHITTRVMGTFGYMAPEYASSGKLTEKSDVYSFGVVLLELITGRKPVDASQPLGDESLVEWARQFMTDALDNQELQEMIDPRLERNYVEREVFRMIEAAAACVRHSAAKRPRMGQVLRALDGVDNSSDLTNGIRPGQSEVFNSAQQSAEIRMFQRMAFGNQDYSSDIFSRSSWGSQRTNTAE